MYVLFFILVFGIAIVYALFKSKSNLASSETVEERELQKIDSVIIGSQKWMQSNLNVVKFRNGDLIEQALNKEQWKQAALNSKPAWCYYLFDKNNSKEHGILYNYFAVSDERILAPIGWEIPSIDDWNILIEELGGKKQAYNKLKSIRGWKANNNGNNSSNFNAHASGLIDRDGGFCCKGEIGNWWSSTKNESDDAWIVAIGVEHNEIGIGTAYITAGLSIRCISEDSRTSTIKIGNQTWMQNNLNLKRFQNGDIIFNAKSNKEWVDASINKIPAWCYYDNDKKNETRDGILYNWYAVHDSRKLAPKGFEIASDEDWIELSNYLGDSKNSGHKLKSKKDWQQGGNGDNEFKFNSYPTGGRSYDGVFDGFGWGCGWWTSTSYDINDAYVWDVRSYDKELRRGLVPKGSGSPVRCIQKTTNR